jgi:hypothetical protein
MDFGEEDIYGIRDVRDIVNICCPCKLVVVSMPGLPLGTFQATRVIGFVRMFQVVDITGCLN